MARERKYYSEFEKELNVIINEQYGNPAYLATVLSISRSNFNKIFDNGIKSVRRLTRERIAEALSLDYKEFEKGVIKVKELSPEEVKKMEDEIRSLPKLETNPFNPIEKIILEKLRTLDVVGQYKVKDYIDDIQPKYPKKEN